MSVVTLARESSKATTISGKMLNRSIQLRRIKKIEISSIGATIGGGILAGILIGFAIKKVLKLVAVAVGLLLAGGGNSSPGRTPSAVLISFRYPISRGFMLSLSANLKRQLVLVLHIPYR